MAQWSRGKILALGFQMNCKGSWVRIPVGPLFFCGSRGCTFFRFFFCWKKCLKKKKKKRVGFVSRVFITRVGDMVCNEHSYPVKGVICTCSAFFCSLFYYTFWRRWFVWEVSGHASVPILSLQKKVRPSSQPSWPPPKDWDNTFHFKGSTKTSQQNARRNPHCSTAPSQIHIKFEKKKKSRRTSFESFVVTNFERDEKPHMYISYEAVHIPVMWYCPAPSSYGSSKLSVNP